MQGSIQLIGRYQNSLPTLDTMAPVAIPCEFQGCVYTTAEFEPEIAIQMLAYHRQDVHPQVQQPPQVGGQAASAKPRAEKVPRPQIKLGIGQDKFSYFKNGGHHMNGPVVSRMRQKSGINSVQHVTRTSEETSSAALVPRWTPSLNSNCGTR